MSFQESFETFCIAEILKYLCENIAFANGRDKVLHHIQKSPTWQIPIRNSSKKIGPKRTFLFKDMMHGDHFPVTPMPHLIEMVYGDYFHNILELKKIKCFNKILSPTIVPQPFGCLLMSKVLMVRAHQGPIQAQPALGQALD